MRRVLCALVSIAALNLAAHAQDAPKAVVFGGFSVANYELIPAEASQSISNITSTGNPSGRLNLFGWNGSVAVNVNRWFSFATDFSGYYSGSSVSTTNTETIANPCVPVSCAPVTETNVNVASRPRIYNFLFGPQFSYPGRKFSPFAHFLIGGEHSDVTRSESLTSSSGLGTGISALANPLAESGIVFAMALGGGVDYSITRNLAWRIQSDSLTNQGTGQNHVRVSTGLAWRLGN